MHLKQRLKATVAFSSLLSTSTFKRIRAFAERFSTENKPLKFERCTLFLSRGSDVTACKVWLSVAVLARCLYWLHQFKSRRNKALVAWVRDHHFTTVLRCYIITCLFILFTMLLKKHFCCVILTSTVSVVITACSVVGWMLMSSHICTGE